jgi:lactate permease
MFMSAALAAIPILIILILMLGFRWPAARAGLVGLIVSLTLAWIVFGYGRETYADIGPVAATGGALAEAVFTAATILWIIIPALALYQLQIRTGALEVLRMWVCRLSNDPRIIVIMVAWFFTLFIEGAAAFGSTIALAAPFLVSFGYRPVEAITIVLIGHAVGASFGALGTPVIPQVEATSFSAVTLSGAISLYHSLFGWLMLGTAMFLATRAMKERVENSRAIWGWTLLAAVGFIIPFYLISRFIGPELPNMVGAAIGGAIFILAFRLVHRPPSREDSTACSATSGDIKLNLWQASASYLILVVLVLVTRLIPPLQQALSGVVWEWSLFGIFGGTFQPLYQPGTLLFIALFLGAIAQRARWVDLQAALVQTFKQVVPVTLALVAMLGLSRVMVYAGMIDSLAVAAAALAGSSWPVIAPFVGVLGTFITGSATASNILFTDFQQATAQSLGLSELTIVSVQGFGAGVGNAVAPHNIIAGGATVGLSGQEGAVLRRTLPAALIYTALGGLTALLFF